MDLAVDLKPGSSGADQADVRASPSLKCYVAEGSSFNTSGSKMQDEWILSLTDSRKGFCSFTWLIHAKTGSDLLFACC